jgi:Protein of unknown function (DUF742)
VEQAQPPSRFVRQFALTQGRVRSAGTELALDTLVRRTDRGVTAARALRGEQLAIIHLTESTISVAEVSAHLHLHLGIARVLVSDMAALGYVVVSASEIGEGGPDLPTLERLLDDLQSL